MLLSSLEGAAVTSIQIRDVYHEFSTIPGVKEDVTQIVLNVKKLRLKSYAPHPVQLRLLKSGAGAVTANDIEPNADVEIVNPDQHLLTLDSDDMPVEIDMTVERGVGYLAAERTDQLPIGVIPVDAIFSPVRKVNYTVENTRVGQMTNFDKLTIEIETDGTLTPEEALSRAAEILVSQFSLFTTAGKQMLVGGDRHSGRAGTARRTCSTCRSRSSTCRCAPTTRSSATTSSRSASCCSLQDEDLLRMRNFGKKSLDEMKERLRMRGFLPPDDGSEGADYDAEDGLDDSAAGRGRVVNGAPDRRPQAQSQDRAAQGAVPQPDRRGSAL